MKLLLIASAASWSMQRQTDRLCNILEIDPNDMLIIATFNMELF